MRYPRGPRGKQNRNGTAEPLPVAERERMVAVAAYYIAERRGFAPGREEDDWRQAEQQIDRMLGSGARKDAHRDATLTHDDVRNALCLPA